MNTPDYLQEAIDYFKEAIKKQSKEEIAIILENAFSGNSTAALQGIINSLSPSEAIEMGKALTLAWRKASEEKIKQDEANKNILVGVFTSLISSI